MSTKPIVPGELHHFRVLNVLVKVDSYTCIASSVQEAEQKTLQGQAQRDSEFSADPISIAALTFDRAELQAVPKPEDIAHEISRAWSMFIQFMKMKEQKMQEAMQQNLGAIDETPK
jgi:hypothetical protein